MNDLREALAGLILRRDTLNTAITALEVVLQPSVWPPAAAGAHPATQSSPRQARRPTARHSRQAVRRESPPKRITKVPVSSVRADTANARDEAIRAALRRSEGIATSKVLRAAMPKEAGLTDDQKRAAFSNTMTRLRGKGEIDRTGDTWSLVGLGSERA